MKRLLSLLLLTALLITSVSAMAESEVVGPFGRYPETVTVRIGSTTTTDLLEDGISESGNLYNDYLLEQSNIVVDRLWTVDNDTYATKISLGIVSGDLPDMFIIKDEQQLKMLVENDMLADLTDAYETKAADYIKAFYDDYGDRAFDSALFDDRLMAIPDLNYGYQFDFVWVRKDWLDKLDLELPTSLQDCLDIAQAFIDNDMSGNGDTLGFPCAKEVAGHYNSCYMMDPALNTMGAYLRSWLVQGDGSIVYGSVQPEAKEALQFLADMYKDGLIDQEFAVRDWDSVIQLLLTNRIGICFGPWYLPDVTMHNMKVINPDSDWVPVLAPLSDDGKIHPMDQQIHKNYLCVRKDYEHPEIAWEMINYTWLRGENPEIEAITEYYREELGADTRVVSPWGWAGAIMVQWNDAVPREGKIVQDAINNGYDTTGLSVEMAAFMEASRKYLEEGDLASWYVYSARVQGCLVSSDDEKIETQPMCYPPMTDTMALKWASMATLEDETILKIVMGEEPIDSFDTFVEQWHALGGTEITAEVNGMYRK